MVRHCFANITISAKWLKTHQTATLPESRRFADGFERCGVISAKTSRQVDLGSFRFLILADIVEQRQLLQTTR